MDRIARLDPTALLTHLGTFVWVMGLHLAAPFHPKAKAAIAGRKELWRRLEKERDQLQGCVWMHCASVGEFEQGAPVLEGIKQQFPTVPVLLTFYSPSGYEAHRGHPLATHVEYLPFDTPGNARRICSLLRPRAALWVRYEFWLHHLAALQQAGVPTFLLSATFRRDQLFFRWYGGPLRRVLRGFHRIFVQDEASLRLLESIDVKRASRAGDTRFDRVRRIADEGGSLPLAHAFHRAYDAPVLIAGSTWPEDEALLAAALKGLPNPPRLLLVPHEPTEGHVRESMQNMPGPVARWTELAECMEHGTRPAGGPNDDDPLFARTLVMDVMGLLSRAYHHADMAYVGGGFGSGIHSVLEAAAWGRPVIVGPRHGKFPEVQSLIDAGAAVEVRTADELMRTLSTWMERPQERLLAGMAAARYVQSMAGATDRTLPPILAALSRREG